MFIIKTTHPTNSLCLSVFLTLYYFEFTFNYYNCAKVSVKIIWFDQLKRLYCKVDLTKIETPHYTQNVGTYFKIYPISNN